MRLTKNTGMPLDRASSTARMQLGTVDWAKRIQCPPSGWTKPFSISMTRRAERVGFGFISRTSCQSF